MKEISVSIRQFLLVGDGDNLPIRLIDIHDNLLILLVVLCL